MKLWDVITTANCNLWRNKGRSILTILAIFIGSFTIILTSGIRTGVNGYIDKQLDSAGGEGYIEIMPKATLDQMTSMMGGSSEPQEYSPEKNGAAMQTINSDDMAKILEIDGMESVQGFQPIETEYIGSNDTDKRFLVSVNEMPTDKIKQDIAAGRMVDVDSETPEIMLQTGYAEVLGFGSDSEAVGKTVKVGVANIATNQITEIEATVSGVLNKSVISLGRSWINGALNDELLNAIYAGLPDSYRDMVYLASGEFDEKIGEDGVIRIKEELEKLGFVGQTLDDQVGMMKIFFDAILTVFTIFGGIALLAASIGIINTLFMAVQERTREIGLMRAMGLSKSKVRQMFSLEAILLGFWGSVVGVVVAFALGSLVNVLATETFLADLPGFTLIQFTPVNVLIMVLIVMLVAFLAGTLPARKAAKQDPIDALRYE